jgi:lipoprotein-releasing system ATP-binding protein
MQIEAVDLGHRFGVSSKLFENLSFNLSDGNMVAITGPSGAGKSTVLAMLAGWLEPTEGRLFREPEISMTWVPQNPYGVRSRLAIDHVALPLLAAGATRTQANMTANRLLSQFALQNVADRPYAQLSGGEAQRLMLARALATDSQLILVDEPTAQLDRANAAVVTEVLGALAGEGRVVVIATHDPRVVEVCKTVINLDRS